MFNNEFNSKYSNVLTIILIVVIVAILGLVAFLGYDFYRKYYIDKEAEEFMSQYENQLGNTISDDNTIGDNTISTIIDPVNEITPPSSSGGGNGSSKKVPTYKGYNVLGIIEIPKTGIKYPVLDKVTPKSIQLSVAYYYGPGLNKVGNTTIYGHNYRTVSYTHLTLPTI